MWIENNDETFDPSVQLHVPYLQNTTFLNLTFGKICGHVRYALLGSLRLLSLIKCLVVKLIISTQTHQAEIEM